MNNSTNNKKNYFTFDFFNKTIYGSKRSFTKASKGFGEEYEELISKMAQQPTFELFAKEPESRSTKAKRNYKDLDYKFMEAYIATKENAEELLNQYNAVKKFAEESKNKVFPFVKKWFIETFRNGDDGFDMKAAKEAIEKARQEKFEKYIANVTNENKTPISVVPAKDTEEEVA